MTNYDLIIQAIYELGVDTVFVYPGHGIIPLLDRINMEESLRMIVCSCEQETVIAADAYGRYKGAGVAIVTYGVGGLSTLNQVGNAVISRSPLWIISGRPSVKEKNGPFQWSSVGDTDAYLKTFRSIGCAAEEFTECANHLSSNLFRMISQGEPFYMEIDPQTGLAETSLTISITKPSVTQNYYENRFSCWIIRQLVDFDLAGPLDLSSLPKEIYKSGDAYLTYDVGEASFAASQLVPHFEIPEQDILVPFPWATMGFAIPAAIGVAFATNKPVIAITGDGSLRLSMLSLSTITRYELPIKIILIDNDGFETERMLSDAAQTAAYNNLSIIHYDNLFALFGIHCYDNLPDMLNYFGYGAHIIRMKGPSPRMKAFSEKAIKSVM